MGCPLVAIFDVQRCGRGRAFRQSVSPPHTPAGDPLFRFIRYHLEAVRSQALLVMPLLFRKDRARPTGSVASLLRTPVSLGDMA